MKRAAPLLAMMLVAGALPTVAAQASAAGGVTAIAGVAKRGAESGPHRCMARARPKARRRACRRARLGLRVGPRVFDRLVDLGGGPAPRSGGFPSPAPDAPRPPATPEPAPPLPDYVAVTATEWRLSLSRPFVGAGLVTVELRNMGEDPHDLVVAPQGGGAPAHHFAETDPGLYTAAGMQLAVGSYTLFCSLPGHAAAGMTATLEVRRP